MFELAFFIGIYSYVIFALGLFGLLYPFPILATTVLSLLLFVIYLKREKHLILFSERLIYKDKWSIAGVILFSLLAIVNLIGALGPELGFDALWYHLTLPKLYLVNHKIAYFPGGLLYYSTMPKLIEMLYTSLLSFGNEQWAKTAQWIFGLLSSIVIYKISLKFTNKRNAMMGVLLFYASFVVAWQSITAYVDLGRTFYESMALFGFVLFLETEKKQWLIESALMLGLAISVKLLSIGSLPIFILLLVISRKEKFVLLFCLLALSVSLPWFIFSYLHTGNAVYPFFSSIYPVAVSGQILNPVNFLKEILIMFTDLSDRINPLYLLFFIIVPVLYRRLKINERLILFYCLIAIVIWYITPRTGGGRFILPYLPGFSVLSAIILEKLHKQKTQLILISLILFITAFTIVYRSAANVKYIPVILGKETKDQFLTKNLNFNFGDFYDTDNYFKNHITSSDTVLTYGFHNLYYIDFPFIDSSWVQKGSTFNYIAVQSANLPSRFSYWQLIYENPKTHVKLYTLGGQQWMY